MVLTWLVRVSPLHDMLGSAVAYVASHVLSAAWGRPIDWLVTDGSTIGLGMRQEGAFLRADVETMPMTRNVPMFIASVYAFGGWRSPVLWWISVVGTMMVIALDGVVLVAVTWPSLALASGIMPTAAYSIIEVARTNFGTGGLTAAPAFLGATLGWAKGSATPAR